MLPRHELEHGDEGMTFVQVGNGRDIPYNQDDFVIIIRLILELGNALLARPELSDFARGIITRMKTELDNMPITEETVRWQANRVDVLMNQWGKKHADDHSVSGAQVMTLFRAQRRMHEAARRWFLGEVVS